MALLVLGQCAYLLVGAFEARFVLGVGNGPVVPPDPPEVRFLRQNVRPGDYLLTARTKANVTDEVRIQIEAKE